MNEKILQRTGLLVLATFGWTVASTLAASAAEPFVAPDCVRELDELEEAMATASSERKGITFLLMEPGST